MNWKQLLKILKLEQIKSTAPAFFEQSGGYGMQVKPYRDDTANGLTTAIIDFIRFIGNGEASRISSTGMPRIVNGEVKWTKSNTRKGAADVRATYSGRSISIEVKIGSDEQSTVQRREQQLITNAGGLYYVAKTFPEFLTWFVRQFPEVREKLAVYGFYILQAAA